MALEPCQRVNRQRYCISADGRIDAHLSEDLVITEEPLNIVLHWTCQQTGEELEKTFMVTMRTPGDDPLLVTGLLLSYAIISKATQIQSITCDETNQCDVTLDKTVLLDWKILTRQFVSHSGCGICGANDVKKLARTFVIGDLLIQNIDNSQHILMLSGRVSFELMQKAVAAKIPVVVAIGAPSNLAVSVAKQFNITLIGFVSANSCNVYHGDFRLIKE